MKERDNVQPHQPLTAALDLLGNYYLEVNRLREELHTLIINLASTKEQVLSWQQRYQQLQSQQVQDSLEISKKTQENENLFASLNQCIAEVSHLQDELYINTSTSDNSIRLWKTRYESLRRRYDDCMKEKPNP